MTENVGLNTPVEQISAEEYQAPSNSSKIIHKLTAYLKEHFLVILSGLLPGSVIAYISSRFFIAR